MRDSYINQLAARFYKPQSKLDWVMVVIMVVILADTIINAFHNGDFIGYINVGYKVLSGNNLYFGKEITWGYFNTWPPFFSVAAVPLALLDSVSPYMVRFLWLLGSWAALFVTLKMAVFVFLNKNLKLPLQRVVSSQDQLFASGIILLPLLLTFRLLMDNSSHLQINLYMMLMAMSSVYFAYKKQPVLAGLILGFSIAIKVYTIFILLYFIYKKAYEVAIATTTFVLIFTLSTFLVLGDLTLPYHHYWFNTFVLGASPTSHMNQSLLATMMRWLSPVETGLDFTTNIANMSISQVKRVYYILIIAVSIVPIYFFRKKLLFSSPSVGQTIQWAVVFCVIPLLSPVAWKYYYVFMWLPIFVFYYLIFEKKLLRTSKMNGFSKWVFYSSVFVLIFSSELFIGIYTSDVLEVMGVITLGGLLMLFALFLIYFSIPQDYRDKPFSLFENEK